MRYSRCERVTRGVPQGSILGPILYILYSADIINHISHCNHHLYADDIQLHMSFDPCDTRESVLKINSDLERISLWSEHNTLELNATKTKYMILGTPQIVKRVEEQRQPIQIRGVNIDRVSEARILGILFDEQLRFEKYINTTIANCFYRLKILYQIRSQLSPELRVRLCEALVLSKFTYADVMYGPRLLARSKNAIQRVQNACARFCWNIPSRSHVTPYLMEAGCLKMESRRRLHFASLLFDVITSRAPCYLFNKLLWMGDSNNAYRTRASLFGLSIPRYYTAAFRGSFTYNATKCWNNLPPPLRNSCSIKRFKIHYKLLLLSEFRSQT